jgi:putative ABC transport system permease protein
LWISFALQRSQNVPADFFKTIEKSKPFVQLVPMSKWHLYSELESGKPSGGRITFVWLFSIVGIFGIVISLYKFYQLKYSKIRKKGKGSWCSKAVPDLTESEYPNFFIHV